MNEFAPDEYDSPWKEAVERYFPEFMAFYFPDAANLIDWMMRLPKELERQLWQNIHELEEHGKMQYISSVERIGMEKGMQKGKLEAEQNTLRRQIFRRFKTLPAWADERIEQAGQSELEQWLDNIIDAPTIDTMFESNNSTH